MVLRSRGPISASQVAGLGFTRKPCLTILGQVARWLDSGAVQSLQQLDLSSVIDRVARYAEHEAEPRRFG